MSPKQTLAYVQGPKTLAERLDQMPWWRRITPLGGLVGRRAAVWLRQLDAENHDLRVRLAQQERAFNNERRKLEKEAAAAVKDIYKRTLVAIEEMEGGRNFNQKEKAVAVILSPLQYETLTRHGFFRQSKIAKLDLYVAAGVYGPVVLTQDGFNGFTRNAPELRIVSKRPTNGRDW